MESMDSKDSKLSLRLFMRVCHFFMWEYKFEDSEIHEEVIVLAFLGMLLFESDYYYDRAVKRISALNEEDRECSLLLKRS